YDADPHAKYSTSIRIGELRHIAGRLKAKHIFVALDACFSGALFRLKGTAGASRQDDSYYEWARNQKSRLGVTAGTKDQRTWEIGERGFFTQRLLEALSGAADTIQKDGVITGTELGIYLKQTTPQVARMKYGRALTPQFGKLDEGSGDFLFIPPKRGDDEEERLRKERERLRREVAGLKREREALEKAQRLEEGRKRVEAERRRVAEEKKRIAALKKDIGARPRSQPPKRRRVAVGPGTPQQIGSGLDTMVLVPAGYFIRGSTSEEVDDALRMSKKVYNSAKRGWFEREMPQRRIYLDAFYIDKYPVTNARFRRFGKPKTDHGSKFNGARQPVVGVTWSQARDYCGSVGKRLPTEAEWEKAARGVDGRKYPWGNQWDGSKVIWSKNSGGKTHPVDRTSKTHRSPYGAVDMSGNVWQWVGDWFKADYYRSAPARNPKGPA
ncbi:MAG: SUMF1/EgtB/PvdO family nonheme iron enzyme, partial [Nitrospinota bacterium]|nr:SUMF1/EgtB/PvdO family nonheme iron enzyme [Nitrospinota bacterium]